MFSIGMLACSARADIILGSAANFAILAGTTVTSTGLTVVTGDLGVSPGTAIVGFPPGVLVGALHSNDGAASQGEADLTVAYNYLSGVASNVTLSNIDLGGLTLTSGVYKFDAAADLTGTLTLSGPGTFIFQVGTALTVANDAAILTIAGANASNVYFQIGSSETVGTAAALEGNIVALQSISFDTGSSLIGRALAINGAVTLDDNAIDAGTAAPEPGTFTLFGIALAGVMGWGFNERKAQARTARAKTLSECANFTSKPDADPEG